MTLPRLPQLALAVLLTVHGWSAAQSAAPGNWVGSWSAAPDAAGPALPAQTIRQVIRTSVGGAHVRVRLSNLFGNRPLIIGAAHIGARAGGAAIRPSGGHALSFEGAANVTIAPGASVLSDAVAMYVAALQELAVSVYLPAGSGPSTIHGAALQTAYIAPGQDHSGATAFPDGATDDSRYFLTDVEVSSAGTPRAIVVIGDSIADGIGSTEEANLRWPDVLAQLLQEEKREDKREAKRRPAIAVLNAGIAGNRLLKDGARPFVGPSVLARFERDALDKPGVRWVVLAHGINDIVASDMLGTAEQQASAAQIIDGMRTLIRRARARGVGMVGATLLPLGGVRRPFLHTPEGESKRQAVNAWIRDGGEFDAVLDFDALLRDPTRPERLLPRFDSGDHLHPNDAGYRAMAGAAHALWPRLETAAQAPM